MRTKLLVRAIAALGIAFVLLACGIAITGLASRPGDADAALVFGNTVERSGLPSRRLAARLDAALGLYAARRVRLILVSGATGKEGFDEALVMRRYLLEHGVPDSALIVDRRGINTRATCVNALRLLDARGASSVDVVTQYFHILRARLAAERAGLRVAGAVAPRFFELRDFYSLGREMFALPAYALGSGTPRSRSGTSWGNSLQSEFLSRVELAPQPVGLGFGFGIGASCQARGGRIRFRASAQSVHRVTTVRFIELSLGREWPLARAVSLSGVVSI